jgi:hypothetical protein
MIFVPLPRFVFSTWRPFFCGRETRVDKCFTDIDGVSDTEFVRKGSHDPRHHRGGRPKVRQSVRCTECRSGRTGGFSKVALGHHVVSWASELAVKGLPLSSVRSHVWRIPVLMPLMALRRSTRSSTVSGVTSGWPTTQELSDIDVRLCECPINRFTASWNCLLEFKLYSEADASVNNSPTSRSEWQKSQPDCFQVAGRTSGVFAPSPTD